MTVPGKPRAAPRRPRAIDGHVVGGPEVIRLDYATGKRPAARRVVIFSVNGKDYSAPENPPAGVTLAYLDELRANGAVSANALLLELMLGAEGYAALRSHPTLEVTDLNKVISRLVGIVAGTDGPKDEP